MKTSARQAILREIERRDHVQIESIEAALTALDAPPRIVEGFRSLTGLGQSLPVPCGADAAARRDLAKHWIKRVTDACDFGAGINYAEFEIGNPNWRCPAHIPRVPLRTMEREVLPRLKRLRHLEIAYAPALRVIRDGDQQTIQPTLRVLVYGLGLSRADAGFIDSVRRDLGGGRTGTFLPVKFRLLTRDKLAAGIFRLLELDPARRTKTAKPATASPRMKMNALIRAMVTATLPFKSVAGGTGLAKQALAGAMGDWTASLKQRPRSRTTIASNEIYPTLGEVLIVVNGTQMRLPFWPVE